MNGCRADGERSKILRRLTYGTTTLRRGEDSFVVSYLASRGKRHPIVFLHGLGTSKADVLPAVQERSMDGHPIVAFDFPGFGETTYPSGGGVGILDLVDLTEAVLDALDLREPVVVGHSMGGLVGLLLARRIEGRLAGFVNVEGNLGPEDCFYTMNAAKCVDREGLRDDFVRPLIARLLKSEDPGAWRYASQLRSRLNLQAFLDYSRSVVNCCRSVDLLAEFQALRIPKLYLYGANSESLPYLSSLRASQIDSAELTVAISRPTPTRGSSSLPSRSSCLCDLGGIECKPSPRKVREHKEGDSLYESTRAWKKPSVQSV